MGMSHQYMIDATYDFFTQKVSSNFEDCTLHHFFEELFNYCLSIRFRSKWRKKLNCTFQNDRSVSAYIHKLEEFFNLIGMVDERDQVIKLWNGR